MNELFKDQYALRKRLVIAALVLSILPFILFVSWPSGTGGNSVTLKGYTLFVTSIFGLVGTVMMLWQFLLGTRVLIRFIIPDMSWSLKLHKWLGTYGSLFIWLHPLLGIYALGMSLWYIFIPDFSSRYETYISYGRVAFLLFIVIWVTSAIVRGKMKYRPWKYIHLSAYILLPLVFLHAVVNGIQLGQSRLLLYYWYGLTILYLIMAAIRVGYQFGHGKQQYQVVGRKFMGNTVLIVLKPDFTLSNNAIIPKPGQYVYVQLDNIFSESHPFTVVDYDPTKHYLALAIRKYGKFTNKIQSLNEGALLHIDGPYGVFTDELNRSAYQFAVPVVMIAGGIGVTAFIKHIRSATSHDTILFNCNRDPQSTLFANRLKRHLRDGYVDVFSRANPTELPTTNNVEYGYISTEIVEKYLNLSPDSYIYFICGTKQFMKTAQQILVELGVPKNQVKSEEFSF